MVRGGKCQRCTVGTVDWKKQSSWCWTQVSMIVFLLTPPLQLTIPKVTIFHPPWLLVYGTIQASRDSISGETLKTHWGDDIFLFWRFKISQVYFRNFSIYSNLQKHEQCFQNGTSIMFSILSESTGDSRGIVYNTRVFGPSSSMTLVVTNFFGDHWSLRIHWPPIYGSFWEEDDDMANCFWEEADHYSQLILGRWW